MARPARLREASRSPRNAAVTRGEMARPARLRAASWGGERDGEPSNAKCGTAAAVTRGEMARPARLRAASHGGAGRYAQRDGEAGASEGCLAARRRRYARRDGETGASEGGVVTASWGGERDGEPSSRKCGTAGGARADHKRRRRGARWRGRCRRGGARGGPEASWRALGRRGGACFEGRERPYLGGRGVTPTIEGKGGRRASPGEM